MRPAYERRRYNETLPLMGWAHTQNDPCFHQNTSENVGCKMAAMLSRGECLQLSQTFLTKQDQDTGIDSNNCTACLTQTYCATNSQY